MVTHPDEVFKFMITNSIGSKTSLFWIAWAFVAEKSGNDSYADKIFHKGLTRFAEPKDILQSRYSQFKHRVARKYLNSLEIDAPVDSTIISTAMQLLRTAQPTVTSRSALTNRSAVQPSQQQQTSASRQTKTSQPTFQILESSNNNTYTNNRDSFQPSWKNIGTDALLRKENEGAIPYLYSLCISC